MATKKEFTSSEEEEWERDDEWNCLDAAKEFCYEREWDIYDDHYCIECKGIHPLWHFMEWTRPWIGIYCRACRKKKKDAWWIENSRECTTCHKRHGLWEIKERDTCEKCRWNALLNDPDEKKQTLIRVAQQRIAKWYKKKYASVPRCGECHARWNRAGPCCWCRINK
jgi:hypothetical protein